MRESGWSQTWKTTWRTIKRTRAKSSESQRGDVSILLSYLSPSQIPSPIPFFIRGHRATEDTGSTCREKEALRLETGPESAHSEQRRAAHLRLAANSLRSSSFLHSFIKELMSKKLCLHFGKCVSFVSFFCVSMLKPVVIKQRKYNVSSVVEMAKCQEYPSFPLNATPTGVYSLSTLQGLRLVSRVWVEK